MIDKGAACIPIYIDPRIKDMILNRQYLRELIPRSLIVTPGNWFTRLIWRFIEIDYSRLDKMIKSNNKAHRETEQKINALYKYIKTSKKLNKSAILRKLTMVKQ